MVEKPGPAKDAEAGGAFYAEVAPGLDVGHFATMWHIVSLGHLVATEIDRISRRHGLSSADLHLLGTLRIFGPRPLRATDLALKLHVSNAVLSARVARLQAMQLLSRERSRSDKRCFDLTLTAAGAARADAAIGDISRTGRFGRGHTRLSRDDQAAVERVLGQLHDMMDRHFLPAPRGGA